MMFLVPANLTPGVYSLAIRSALGNSPVRTSLLADVLGIS
jgi:hypothetical protein